MLFWVLFHPLHTAYAVIAGATSMAEGITAFRVSEGMDAAVSATCDKESIDEVRENEIGWAIE